MTTNFPRGNFTSMFCRLCVLAPWTVIQSSLGESMYKPNGSRYWGLRLYFVMNGIGDSKRTGSSFSGWMNSKLLAWRHKRPGSCSEPWVSSPTTGHPNSRIAIRIWWRRPVSIIIWINEWKSSESSTRQWVIASLAPLYPLLKMLSSKCSKWVFLFSASNFWGSAEKMDPN